MKTRLMIISALIAIATGLTGCVDELLNPDNEFGDGEAVISAEAVFQNFTSTGLGTRTPGNTLGNIDKLDVFIFKPNGELIGHYPIPKGNWTSTEENTGRPDDKETTEDPTMRVKFTLPAPLHYGRYKMYAVANVEADKLQGVETIDDLLGIQLTWNPDDIPANNQMLGFFETSDTKQGANYDSFNAPSIAIKTPNTTLYAWVRRAASKVTVAYDGSDLLDNVYIYLKSVTVHNVNKTAYLGKKSKANSSADVYESGETTYYYDRTKYPAGPPQSAFGPDWESRVMKGVYNETFKGSDHSDKADALFFYENMQGKGESKLQDADHDGEIDSPDSNDPNDPDWRDKMPNGTYIEVKAHYVSNIPGHMGNAEITYRFMLGQNIEDNYDVMRNCHYKVTLHFNKYANDVDWHIEYEEPEPGIEVPNPYYISYLYNHSMMLPLKIRTGGQEIKQIEARIMDNRWAPNNPASDFVYWDRMDLAYQNQWNGFLSLRQTKDLNLTATSNEEYYNTHKRGEREYIPANAALPMPGESKEYETFDDLNNSDGKCIIRNEGDSVFHVQLPMYTRAKQLIKRTGYTGNNPYVAYQRKSEVKIVVTFTNGSKISTDGTDFDGRPLSNADNKDNQNPVIYQVRRIVNPKGVWRSHGNDKDFHVQLKHLPKENATQFETFTSEGPWKAYVYCGTGNFITLSDETRASTDTIKGETGSAIDFRIKFNGTCGQQENRYAIIRVEYHNYTCYHLIFVRQGDAPDDLFDGTGTKWHAHNLRTSSKETDSPLEEGSLFKFQNLEQPIDAMCNKNPTSPWININPGSFQNDADKLQIATNNTENKTNTTWNSIKSIDFSPWDPSIPEPEFKDLDISNARIASFDDFLALYQGEDIAEGYGVLYGDESHETLNHITEVYGYDYENTQRGMRGCFIYNKKNGKNLFFPIGASGYGHRKDNDSKGGNLHSKGAGILRYASYQNAFLPDATANNTPLFYDIYMRPGAVYWLNKYSKNKNHSMGSDFEYIIAWDFNYFTFDFFPYGVSAANNGKDACFIRCVEE